jgi:hypothetical protein
MRELQLERRLCADDSKCRHEARKLFTFNTACGVYLARGQPMDNQSTKILKIEKYPFTTSRVELFVKG